jgi:hypothetical protein
MAVKRSHLNEFGKYVFMVPENEHCLLKMLRNRGYNSFSLPFTHLLNHHEGTETEEEIQQRMIRSYVEVQ